MDLSLVVLDTHRLLEMQGALQEPQKGGQLCFLLTKGSACNKESWMWYFKNWDAKILKSLETVSRAEYRNPKHGLGSRGRLYELCKNLHVFMRSVYEQQDRNQDRNISNHQCFENKIAPLGGTASMTLCKPIHVPRCFQSGNCISLFWLLQQSYTNWWLQQQKFIFWQFQW